MSPLHTHHITVADIMSPEFHLYIKHFKMPPQVASCSTQEHIGGDQGGVQIQEENAFIQLEAEEEDHNAKD
jgi:hypothetical protein